MTMLIFTLQHSPFEYIWAMSLNEVLFRLIRLLHFRFVVFRRLDRGILSEDESGLLKLDPH